jgi:hypothetical protein
MDHSQPASHPPSTDENTTVDQADVIAEQGRASHGKDVPERYANHRLVEGRFFFTLPKELLEDIVDAVGEDRFEAELLAMERALSADCGDHSNIVGFDSGYHIKYDLLGSPPDLVATIRQGQAAFPEDLAGWPPMIPERVAALKSIDGRGSRDRDVCQAYNGWLMLNPQFLAEQHSFFRDWGLAVRQIGLDGPPKLFPPDGPSTPPPKEVWDRYGPFWSAREQFLSRWELIRLAGPFLPTPPRPHTPLAAGITDVLPNPALGTTFFFPTISPLPDRQELLKMIDDALDRQRLRDHLKDWGDIIATDNPGRGRAFPRLQRIFVLQHYWRVLFARHAKALDRKIGCLHTVFASFFHAYDDDAQDKARVIKDDLAALAHAHGSSDWYIKPTPVEGSS